MRIIRAESHTHTHTLYSSTSFYILIQFHPPSDFCYLYLNFFLRPPHLTTNFCNEFSVIFFFCCTLIRDCPFRRRPFKRRKAQDFFSFVFFSQHVIIFKIYSTSGSLSKQNKTLNKHFRTHYTVVPLVLLHPAHSFTPRTFDLTQVKTQLKIYHQLFFFPARYLSISHPPLKRKTQTVPDPLYISRYVLLLKFFFNVYGATDGNCFPLHFKAGNLKKKKEERKHL